MPRLSTRSLKIIAAGAVIAVMMVFTAVQTLAASPAAADDVASSLMCNCGCVMILSTCDCGTAVQMMSDIKGMIDQGKTKQEILAYYVAQRGESALAAPTKSGFNITAWVMPFVGLAGGAGVVVFMVGMWVKKNREQDQLLDEEGTALGGEGLSNEELHIDPKASEYEDRLNRDLDELS